MTHVLIRTKHL